MYFFPETKDFRIEHSDEDEPTTSPPENNLGENQVLDIEAAKKPTALKPYRGFLDVMNTMNVKFGYNDGKLST